MRDDAVLALGSDDHQTLGAGVGGFGGDQFDTGGVDDGQQLLRHGFGRGKKARPQTGGGDDRRERNRDLWA